MPQNTKQTLAKIGCLVACGLLGSVGVAMPAVAQKKTPSAHAVAAAPVGEAPLTLSQAIAAALTTNPNAQAAAQQLAQSQARLAQAQAQTKYTISLNSTVSGSHAQVYQQPPSQETFGTLQNTLTIPLPLGPGPRLVVRQANEQLSAAQSQFDAARLTLIGQVNIAYYDLLRKQALLAVAQETQTQTARQLSDTRKRKQAGDVAQLDVLQAQVPFAAAQAQTFGAQTDVAVARQTLNDLIGRPLDAPTQVADVPTVTAALPYSLEQARTFALTHSPDVRAAEAMIRADEAAAQSARLYRRPTVELQAIDIRSKDVTSFSSEQTLQAAVTLPLSDGGLGRARVREAEAALAAARAQA
ncbi:MAG: TolC family protein, partial [Armatimonadota bacterium]|nr:TolC family protein [Armatimonadota bacterium]